MNKELSFKTLGYISLFSFSMSIVCYSFIRTTHWDFAINNINISLTALAVFGVIVGSITGGLSYLHTALAIELNKQNKEEASEFKDRIIRLLYPVFTELEPIILNVVVIITVLFYRQQFIDSFQTSTYQWFIIIIYGMLFGITLFFLGKSIFTKNPLNDVEKKWLLFELLVVTQFLSIDSIIKVSSELSFIQLLVTTFITARNTFAVIFFGNLSSSTRFKDKQVSIKELILILLASIGFFWYLNKNNHPYTTILLAYGYVTIFIYFIRRISKSKIVYFMRRGLKTRSEK